MHKSLSQVLLLLLAILVSAVVVPGQKPTEPTNRITEIKAQSKPETKTPEAPKSSAQPVTQEQPKATVINGSSFAESKPGDTSSGKSEPVPEPQKTYPAGCELYRPIVAKYGWNVEVAMQVMQAESGCNPMAVNPENHYDYKGNLICSGSYGLFQISCHGGVLYDPEQNVAAAWAKYTAVVDGVQQFWSPWGVCLRHIVNCY